MKRTACLILLLSTVAFSQEKQKLPEGALSGDFKANQLCLSLRIASCPPPKLVVPVEIWATKTLVSRYGEAELKAATGQALIAFWYQNGVDFSVSGKINAILEDNDPALTARAIPRKNGTLLILLSHLPFDYGFEVNTGVEVKSYRYAALSGAGWIDMWFDPRGKRAETVRTLVHELGHIFGLKDSDDELSVMCSSVKVEDGLFVKTRNCSTTSIYFNGGELTVISGVVKVMQKSGFEPYEGLMSPVESYDVYDVKTKIGREEKNK